MTKYVYLFTEGDAGMRNLLGGKAANLAEMTRLGLPVPQGFTVSTEACTRYYADGETIAPEIQEQIIQALHATEKISGKEFGNPKNPLLLSIRSGARVSMPGMMDTVLNLGLTDETVAGLAKLTDNPRFAYDSYRRFIAMFGDVVMGVERRAFEDVLEKQKRDQNVELDNELDAEHMRAVTDGYKEVYKKATGSDFPQDPRTQLMAAIKAVFRSWENERAQYYRRMNGIPSAWGTAVTVQIMVYGNMGEDSGTGVAFTRNPADGTNELYGEYLINAQGEDVVAGVRTPQPIATLRDVLPEVYQQFAEICEILEQHYKDMQDMEFTIERGKLYMLQTRNGKRTAAAALKIAVDMVEEGMLSREEALLKLDPAQLDTLLHPTFEAKALKAATPIAKGLPASPGAATGRIYFSAGAASAAVRERGEKVVLVRGETSPEDLEGMALAEGVLTGKGGMTSHAAVVARGMGKCCVAGASELTIDEDKKQMIDPAGKMYGEGDWLSLDGSTGQVYDAQLPTSDAELTDDFAKIMEWSDEYRRMGVRTNADSPGDAARALELGAEGIGLCRTEHMFFEEDRIFAFRKMIVAETREARVKALDEIIGLQRNDFVGIFRAMEDRPVVVRLLDPPLHEFLPRTDKEIDDLAAALGMTNVKLHGIVERLHELNPMMGHRGCRLAISYPEIYEMQTRAIIEAAVIVEKEGHKVHPEIMVPLVCDYRELEILRELIVKTADEIISAADAKFTYEVGTMIEVPRAAILSNEIAPFADFYSFGTNDMTQMTYGLSRDDAGKILDDYYNARIMEADPTAHLDVNGVGALLQLAVDKAKDVKPEIGLGICGEHGGDPASIDFCEEIGLDYVSCSPYRVPIARLAAAQAALRRK
ncbi:MAG: pyruvate, phosphate dikinase [Clostridiaceae bacterium]|nr:pyruvate, phosphate dikinase [Clostridiaceae bacterium]